MLCCTGYLKHKIEPFETFQSLKAEHAVEIGHIPHCTIRE